MIIIEEVTSDNDVTNSLAPKFFNFLLEKMIENKSNVIELKASDFLVWLNINDLQNNYYSLQEQIHILTNSVVVLEKKENQELKMFEWPLIMQSEITFNANRKVEKIKIILNPSYHVWQCAYKVQVIKVKNFNNDILKITLHADENSIVKNNQ